MLFIREYNAKSLDRSSVSMIDKYNTRLDRVGQLLDNLSSLVNSLLSLIRDIRTLLGKSKQRIYDNLDQVKEVIEGNGITGTEATIKTIEDALEAGDKAIDEAEAQLEDIEAAINCSEEYCNDANDNVGVECGETCNQTPSDDDSCNVCGFAVNGGGGGGYFDCEVCDQSDCKVDLSCDEPDVYYTGKGGCLYNEYCTLDGLGCDETYKVDHNCNEGSCNHSGNFNIPEGCTFDCSHSTPCQESAMPDGCTYTCTDGKGCSYGGDDCSYGTVCGQPDSCNQSDCSQYDCGEPCGETCHMTTDDDDSGDSGSCGEDDDLSDDEYYGGDDGDSDMCGEDCGDSCGL